MLNNLKKELSQSNITYHQLGELLNVSEKTIYSKISEQTEFTLGEIKKIHSFLYPHLTFEYLFKTDKSA